MSGTPFAIGTGRHPRRDREVRGGLRELPPSPDCAPGRSRTGDPDPASGAVKRATGLEPALRPWKGLVQPLHHARATKLGPILREAPALTRVLRAQWCILTAFRGPDCSRGLAGGARRGRSPPDLTRRLCPTGPRKGGEPPREQCRPRRPDRAAARAKTSWRVESRGQARDRCATADSLQQTAELLRAEADAAHDAVQRAGLEVAIVDGEPAPSGARRGAS